MGKKDNIKSYSRRGKNYSIKNMAVGLSPGKWGTAKATSPFVKLFNTVDYNKNS